jgi:hypothetical protein
MNRMWRIGVACVLLLVAATSARGETQAPLDPGRDLTPTAREFSDRGLRHYESGEYDASIESFMEAFALSNNAGLLFNVAQAYRLKQDCVHAQEFYARYLETSPETALKASVERRLAEMKSCAAASSATAPPPDEESSTATPAPRLIVSAVPIAASTDRRATTSPRGRAAVWGLRGSAAALLVSSGAFAAFAWDAHRDYEATSFQLTASQANDRFEADTRWALTFGIAGVACAVASYLVGRFW